MGSKTTYWIQWTWVREGRIEKKQWPNKTSWNEAFKYMKSLPEKYSDVTQWSKPV